MEKLYSIKHCPFDYWNPVRGLLKEDSTDIVIANTKEDAERAFPRLLRFLLAHPYSEIL